VLLKKSVSNGKIRGIEMNGSSMSFEEKLTNYANLLVCHGMNVQPGQCVNITAEVIHRKLVEKVAEAAYKRGAKYVHVDFIDPYQTRLRLSESKKDEFLQYVPAYIPKKYEDFIDEHTTVLRLTGSEEPDLLADLPAQKVNTLQSYYRQSLKKYYAEGVGKSKIQWTVAAAATPKWGKKVFPELSEEKACDALWDAIFTICRADRPDCLEIWKKHNKALKDRAKKLTELKIKELHFTGPGTDLKVHLSDKAIFKGGGDRTPQGIDFEANIPTEECFTTPDYRFTEGRVRVTRPVLVGGNFVSGLELEFKNGVITKFSAKTGEESFAAYIASDVGAKRLGEVALVGIDSPVYQSGRVFQEILFDENAACHIAIGFAYRFCIQGGADMSAKELEEIGCNDSHVHTDFMISTEEVDVCAKTHEGAGLDIIRKGKWVI
jgi:aminopeptidase